MRHTNGKTWIKTKIRIMVMFTVAEDELCLRASFSLQAGKLWAEGDPRVRPEHQFTAGVRIRPGEENWGQTLLRMHRQGRGAGGWPSSWAGQNYGEMETGLMLPQDWSLLRVPQNEEMWRQLKASLSQGQPFVNSFSTCWKITQEKKDIHAQKKSTHSHFV